MAYTLRIKKFAPFYKGDSLVSSYSYDTQEEAERAARQNACLSSSDAIEVIDEQGETRVLWTSLYNFIYCPKGEETLEEYFATSLERYIELIEQFIPDFAEHLDGRSVKFANEGEQMELAVIPGTEMILLDACMDAACEAEDARDDGKDDIPVMKTAMEKYQQELDRRQQRYEAHKQRQKDLLARLL